jgi:hypothetical protein
MSVEVFKAACRYRRNRELIPFDELVNTPSDLIEVTFDYNQSKSTGPSRTWKEVQAELIKINGHWTDIKERGEDMSWWVQHTALWINDSHKDEDIFMPSDWAKKKETSSKNKESTSSKPNGAACKGKGTALSWWSDEDDLDDDDHFMPSDWAKKASSTKGKRVAKP